MSPWPMLVILFATGCSRSEVPARFTRLRGLDKRMREDAYSVRPHPDSENVSHHKTRPFYYDPYGPGHRKVGYARHQRNEMDSYNARMYTSYGIGKAEIPYPGATVSVSNAVTYPKVRKGAIAGGTIASREEIGQLVSRVQRKCRSCPRNRKVIASKGNAHVFLPEPCPQLKWHSAAGPEPGTLLREGQYTLIGRVGTRGKLCQYKYEVLVRRCGALKVASGYVNCTTEDAWGSKCTFTCHPDHELEGPEVLECRNDLQWSHEPPVCKIARIPLPLSEYRLPCTVQRIECSYPQTPDNRKVSCQVPEEKELFGDLLPRGTQCRIKGRQTVLTCVDGYWVRTSGRDKKNKMSRNRKHRKQRRKSE